MNVYGLVGKGISLHVPEYILDIPCLLLLLLLLRSSLFYISVRAQLVVRLSLDEQQRQKQINKHNNSASCLLMKTSTAFAEW